MLNNLSIRKKMDDLLGQDHPKPVNKPKTILNQHEPIPDSARKEVFGMARVDGRTIFLLECFEVFLDSVREVFFADVDALWSLKSHLFSTQGKKKALTALSALKKTGVQEYRMRDIRASLEDISYLLRIPQRKPYGTMESNVKKALKVAIDDKDSILASIPADLRDKGSELYASLVDGKGGLQALIESIRYQDPDKVSIRLASSLDTVAEMELLQASGLSFLLPQQYLNYPRLAGRGTVEITIEKPDGSTFQAEAGGDQRKSATIQVVIDGYSAPLTAGNFAKLVTSGAYDGTKLNTVNQAVITEDGSGKVDSVSVPLEVMPSGQFEPLYRTPLSVQDGELPVLPLSVYGAVAMAHSENSEEYSSPYQFFFYLYDKRNSGLGGLSFDEGQFSVFGYTTAGRDILGQIKTGDIIKSAKLIEGQDRLILPAQNNSSST
ncbi:hypothetical protein YC2023_067760 [Brassica napus]